MRNLEACRLVGLTFAASQSLMKSAVRENSLLVIVMLFSSLVKDSEEPEWFWRWVEPEVDLSNHV
jgi:hypothetical protein